MAKKKTEEKMNLDSILFKCRDILRKARNSGSFFEKRDMMLTLVFLRFMGEKFEDGIENLRRTLVDQKLDPDDEEIWNAFFNDPTFTDGTYNLPVEARWSTIINTPAPQLNVALDTALKKEDMSVKRLLTLSEVLKYDFFQYFTEKELHQKPAGSDEMEYTLHIKVPKNKIREVMDYIDRKDLFEILEK